MRADTHYFYEDCPECGETLKATHVTDLAEYMAEHTSLEHPTHTHAWHGRVTYKECLTTTEGENLGSL